MHDDTALVELRLARFVRERLAPAVHRRRAPLQVTRWEVPGEPVPFATARAQAFAPVAPGARWGRPWGTTWFRVTGEAPPGWGAGGVRLEVEVDLGYSDAQPGFQAEATVYRADGAVVKGLHPRNRHVPLAPGVPVDLRVEASSNPDVVDGLSFRPTPLGDPATAGDAPLYRFGGADVVELDVAVWELLQDVRTLRGLLGQLPADLPRRAEVLRALEDAVDAVDPWDVSGTAAAGRAALAAAGLAGRSRVETGDFFEAVPAGGDLYLLQRIVHDWDDGEAARLLGNVRSAMPAHARLLLVEAVVQPGDAPSHAKMLDLNMLVLVGGRERTEEEYRALLQAAGLALRRVLPATADTDVLEAVPAGGA